MKQGPALSDQREGLAVVFGVLVCAVVLFTITAARAAASARATAGTATTITTVPIGFVTHEYHHRSYLIDS